MHGEAGAGKKTRRTEAELKQIRLANPPVHVAGRFAQPERQGTLFEMSALEMFSEHPRSERVHIDSSAMASDTV